MPNPRHSNLCCCLITAALLSALGACTQKAEQPDQPLRFSIMGHLDSQTMHKEALALHTHLEEMLGRQVSVQVLGDYAQVQGHIAGAEVDFSILSPLAYVLVKEKVPGLELLARVVAAGSTSYDGAIVVKADSGIENLAAIHGKTICWVSTSSTSGYLYPRIYLRSEGIDPDKAFSATRLTGGHVDSLRALQDGTCDVAATYTAAPANAAAIGLDPKSFAIIGRTGEMPLDPVVARPGLGAELKEKVRAALLAMDPATDNRLANVRSFLRWEGFIAVKDSDYDVIRNALTKDRAAAQASTAKKN